MFRTHVRFIRRVFGKFLFRLIDQFYAVAVIHSRSLLRRTSDYYKLREKRRKKIFAILFSPISIYIYILYVYKYIYTHDTVKRPHVSPRVPLRIIKPCICHRSEPVSVPRNRNRCLTHSSTRFDKRIGLRPKESFSNPIPRLITSIRTRIISHFTRGKIRFRNGWPFSLSSETCQRVIQRFIDPPPPPPPAFLQFASICDYVRAN